MQPTAPHIEHLAQLLRDHIPVPTSRPLDPVAVDDFFLSIETRRIRFNSHDWQGHGITTLLWRMPDLKPERHAALVAYIARQWDSYVDDVQPLVAATAATDASDPPAGTAPSRPSEDERPTAVERKMTGSIHAQDHFLETLPPLRRDWFDRFTDWVAAVVSLFA